MTTTTLPSTTPTPLAEGIVTLDTPAALMPEEMDNGTMTTCLLIGTLLKQYGRRACEIKPRELERFAEKHDVQMSHTADGSIRFELAKRKG